LLLRGRTREQVMAGLRQRRAGGAASRVAAPVAVDGGVVARDAFARTLSALPVVPVPPRGPGQPVPLAVEPPRRSGVEAADLAALAEDAAVRAWAWCVGEGDGGLGLDPALDAVRVAAAITPGSGRFEVVARRLGMAPAELGRRAAAWRAGGADAVAVLDDTWSPDAEAVDEARNVLAVRGTMRVRANRVSQGDVELRLGRAGYWYRFERVGRRWELVGGPAADPADVGGPL
jgi:hypothetical protein